MLADQIGQIKSYGHPARQLNPEELNLCNAGIAVAYEGPGVPLADAITDSATPQVPELRGDAPGKPRYWAWADLMRRGFDLDVLACPRRGGRMRLLATIEDPQVIRKILAHLGLPDRGLLPQPTPAPFGSRR